MSRLVIYGVSDNLLVAETDGHDEFIVDEPSLVAVRTAMGTTLAVIEAELDDTGHWRLRLSSASRTVTASVVPARGEILGSSFTDTDDCPGYSDKVVILLDRPAEDVQVTCEVAP